MAASFKSLVSTLQPQLSLEEKVSVLETITRTWSPHRDAWPASLIRGSHLLSEFAVVLRDKQTVWLTKFPEWVGEFMLCLFSVSGEPNLFPIEHFKQVYEVYRSYVMADCWDALLGWRRFASYFIVREFLLPDTEFYNVLKRVIALEHTQILFLNLVFGYEAWQLKLLQDTPFIKDLLALPENSHVWGIISSLSQHPDAKTLLPPEVIVKSSHSTNSHCVDIGALLSSDQNIASIKIGEKWVNTKVDLLASLLSQGVAIAESTRHNLLDLVLPIANLSVIEDKKGDLGKVTIPLLMDLVTDNNLPAVPVVQLYLTRGRQEAARALWNFSYLESNRTLISNNDGIVKLKATAALTQDSILKENIDGILFMFNGPTPVIEKSVTATKGHVMISYNWGNQAIVKRLAKALQEQGYNIWLDIEQMAGSTLEAMAAAVEQAEMVLMCMSQKYKDSPNCRLEAEYCVNRRISFIPLMMQQGYKPDGWLGIALGAKLWYDFTDESDWDSKILKLGKVLGNSGKVNENKQTITATPPQQTFAAWSLSDVHEWLKRNHLEQHFERFAQHDVEGHALAELKNLRSNNKIMFSEFKRICEDLGIVKLGEVLRFSAAIDHLQ